MSETEKLRIDKWLWAARFFKTRSLASDAVNGGKVHLNGDRVKAARAIKPGDELRIRKGNDEWTVIVLELHEKRRQASLAQQMYEETEQSRKQREDNIAMRKAVASSRPQGHRPSKKERRHIIRFKREKQQNQE